MEYITSKAVEIRKDNQSYEVVNFITGKSYKVSEPVVDVLNDYYDKKDIKFIETKLLKYNFSKIDIDNLTDFLIRSEILLDSKRDQTIHVVKHIASTFDVGFKDISKLEKNQIVFLGVPYGNGNPTDNKCKDFPNDFREFSSKFLSLRSNGSNIRYRTISNITNFEKLRLIINNKNR